MPTAWWPFTRASSCIRTFKTSMGWVHAVASPTAVPLVTRLARMGCDLPWANVEAGCSVAVGSSTEAVGRRTGQHGAWGPQSRGSGTVLPRPAGK